ncbi:MAG TPA: selenocysteine-specific translation elongation factor [Candidatus Acidoferrales bacterium]|nr:selenocysteine-specific translation elongation factor [Candidatus Acidoferrales bacterium]
MPYIIGTAGHIDHGKTSLIKALTGQDTDRLKEEKERGISIDLGFAYLELPDGSRAGIVDVPGHERFIRNMLAGAHGMDLVLFTVAADDGIMPQTEEHLDILHLLGVKRAIFLITKADLVGAARIKEVEEDIRILTLGTALEDSPVLAFSSVTGQGLDELRRLIWAQLQNYEKGAGSGYFRLPVDRVFVLQGHGLVVTGTALSGTVRTGDRVRALPGDQLFRVRSLQVHNRPVESAGRGQRVALNLAGPEKIALERGDVICDEKLTRSSDRLDAFLEVRPAATKGIKSHQRIRVHLGTAERLGKLILLPEREKAEPKETVYCQITLEEPLLVMRGDRFIVRDETAQRTLGGGTVIHPWARRHRRKEPGLAERLALLRSGEPSQLLKAFLEEAEEFALAVGPIYEFLNVTEEEAAQWIARAPEVVAFKTEREQFFTTAGKWRQFRETILRMLGDFHAAHPLAPGMDMEELRVKLPYRVPVKLFHDLIDILAREQAIARDGSFVRLPAHRVRMSPEEESLSTEVQRLLGSNPGAPPDVKQLERDLGAARAKLGEVLRVLEREGKIVRVTTDLVFAAHYIDKVKAELYKYLSTHGEITAATFRDLIGSSRKYAIGLLEYFDRVGVTTRVGDVRKLRAPAAAKPEEARPGRPEAASS